MGVIGGRKPPHQEDMILYIDAASVFTHPRGTTTFNSMIKNGVVNTDVLTNDNAPTYVEAGHGSYMAFDGVDDALRWNNTGFSSTNEITVAMWMKPRSHSGGTYWRGFFSARSTESGNDHSTGVSMDMRNVARSSFDTFNIETSHGGSGNTDQMTSDIPWNTWTHVVGVVSTSQTIPYINGVAETTKSKSNVSMALDYLVFGARTYGGGTGYAHVDVASWIVFNRVLTPTEILTLYNENRFRYQ